MSYSYARSRWFHAKTARCVEDATSLTHTATFRIPKGWTVYDIIIVPEVLWTATTSATLKVGDTLTSDGYFSTVDLKATDLVLGERLQANSDGFWGATNDAYLTAAGRFGQASADNIGGFMPNNYAITATVTVVAPATTVGRTRVTVLYYRGSIVKPVLA